MSVIQNAAKKFTHCMHSKEDILRCTLNSKYSKIIYQYSKSIINGQK